MPPEVQQSLVNYWQAVFPGEDQQWSQYWDQPVSSLMAASGQAGLTPGGWWDWFNTAQNIAPGASTGAGTTGGAGGISGDPLASLDFSSFQNLFPTSATAAQSGLPPWADQLYQDQLTGFMPAALSGLQGVLGQLADPESFIKAYQPIMDQLYGKKLDEMSKRGILPSSLTSDALRDMNTQLSAVFLQNLASIAEQFRGAGGLAATMGGQTTQAASAGLSQNPLAPWELLFNILGPFEYG